MIGRRRLALLLALLFGIAASDASAQQRRTVTGKITDADTGQPISGAQIVIRGTNTGTLGRADGTFTLNVPQGPVTLVVTFLGYRRTEAPVAATQANVNIQMHQDVLKVDEIVVTGQATGVARRNLANSVAKVNAAELVKAPAASVEQSLMGKVASATIQDLGGGPGGGVLVRLRGTTSLNNAYTPLYVIDGVIVSDAKISRGINRLTQASGNAATIQTDQEQPVGRIADLNPADIESIEVLKGAAASAIYGSKASNGVILITTKKGKVGTPQFHVAQKFGTSALFRPVGGRRFNTVAEAIDAFGPTASQFFQPGVFFDHDRELAGNKPLNYETSATMSGGTETTRYFASALIRHEGGIIRSTYADKQSLRLNIDQNIGNRLQINLSTEGLHTKNDRGLTGNGNAGVSYYDALTTTPSFVDLRATCPDGSRQAFCDGGVYPINPYANSNPLATVAKEENPEDVWRIISAARVQLDALNTQRHSLRLLLNGGVDNFNQHDAIFSPPDLQYEPLDGFLGMYALSFGKGLQGNVNANTVYKFTSAGNFTATTSAGFQWESRFLNVGRTLAEGLVGGKKIVTAATNVRVDEDHEKQVDVGYFVQEEVLWKERLLLTAGVRADKSSNNGDVNQLFWYPKASASYRLNPGGLLDELKLRAAIGAAGNLPTYRTKFTELQGQNVAGVPAARTPATPVLAASDIRPERQREIEVGLDATLLKNRATLEVTAYDKNITELLLRRNLAPVTGFSVQVFNGGAMWTRGLEVGLNAFPINGKDFKWNTNLNYYMSRSKITDLPVPAFRDRANPRYGSIQIEEGKSPTQVIAWVPGPNGERTEGVIGDYNPDYKLGWSNNISFRGLNLYFLLDHLQGGWIHNYTELLYDFAKNTRDYTQNGEARIKAGTTNCSTCAWVQPTTNTKLREATITWDLPQSLVKSLWSGASSVKLSFSGRNLLILTGYRGQDPEVLVRASTLFTQWRADIWPYPQFRTFWAGIDVNF